MSRWPARALFLVVLVAGCVDGAPERPGLTVDGGFDPLAPDATVGPDAAPVTIEYLDPDHGPFAGGTRVTLRGHGFRAGMEVRFAGRLVDPLDLQVVDGRRALLRAPAGEPGAADVAVTVGDFTASSSEAYRYEAALVDPAVGPIAGGTFVRVRGLGTSFAAGDEVTLDGEPLTDVVVVSAQELTGLTPRGVAGDADLRIGNVLVEDAFVYVQGADAGSGGLSGEPLEGSLSVAVLDRASKNGIEGAFVSVGDPATSAWTGRTDAMGHITFSDPALVGRITVTAGARGYERSVWHQFDGRQLTIFLSPEPSGEPDTGGPFPPGRKLGLVRGQIVFGDVLGLGEPTWDGVPEPPPGQIKRAFVYTSAPNVFSGVPDPGAGGTVDYVGDGRIAWDFEIHSRPAAVAVMAVAGLWDANRDPDGDGPQPPGVFTPFVMGVARGVLVGPGDTLEGVTISMDIPLDAALPVELDGPPPVHELGPDRQQVRVFLDLGGEGVLLLKNGKKTLAPGSRRVTFGGLPPLFGRVSDGSYTVLGGSYSGDGGVPFSVRVVPGVRDLSRPLVIDDFLGIPEALDPTPDGLGTGGKILWQPEAGVPGVPTFSYHSIYRVSDGVPVWRAFVRGGLREAPLFDLTPYGVDPLPDEDLVWSMYEVRVPFLSPDAVTYGHLNSRFWSAYTTKSFVVRLPPS